MCGERTVPRVRIAGTNGSSPRVRGTACGCRPAGAPLRFIPACAGNGSWENSPAKWAAVHPRVCGERTIDGPVSTGRRGSSPRVRGTVVLSLFQGKSPRFIPACAGNGCGSGAFRSPPAVHPRVCGERIAAVRSGFAQGGSSPRVRGTEVVANLHQAALRFIPACAGNGPPPVRTRSGPAVHPRVCGERIRSWASRIIASGSSPRVRGTAARP